MGCGIGWTEGDLGHGRAYRFNDPGRPRLRALFGTRRSTSARPAERPALKNIAQRYHGRGVAPRRLDHFNLLASDVSKIRDFMVKALGSRVTEQILLDNGRLGGCWFTVNNKGYDMACTEDHAGDARPLPPHHLRGRPSRGHPARRRHLPGERRLHRDRAAQARDPGHVLPLRLRAGGKPRRGRECRRAPDPGPRLEADHLDGDGAQEGSGLGPEDDRELPYARHAARRRSRRVGDRKRCPTRPRSW